MSNSELAEIIQKREILTRSVWASIIQHAAFGTFESIAADKP